MTDGSVDRIVIGGASIAGLPLVYGNGGGAPRAVRLWGHSRHGDA
ncbi:hypothetical protein [Rhodococcus sp. NPDC057529]